MRILKGNLFEPTNEVNAICITTNGIIKQNGCAVMGKGVALEAVKRYPGIDKILAEKLIHFGNKVHLLCEQNSLSVLSFPTKNHWRDSSDLNLIKNSAKQLVEMTNKNEWSEVWLPSVGCGCGNLSWNIVKNSLSDILDGRLCIVSLDK